MLDVVRFAARRRALAAAFDVEILSLATANPPFRLPQTVAGGEHGWKVVELGNTDPLILAGKDGIPSV